MAIVIDDGEYGIIAVEIDNGIALNELVEIGDIQFTEIETCINLEV